MELLINAVSLFSILVGTIFCSISLIQMFRAGGFKLLTAVDVLRVLNALKFYKIACVLTFLAGYLNPFLTNFISHFAADKQTPAFFDLFNLSFGIPRIVSLAVIFLHLPVGIWLLYLWKEGLFVLIEKNKDLIDGAVNNSNRKNL